MFSQFDRSKLLTPTQVSEILGKTESTLYHWRKIGWSDGKMGPRFLRLGREIRYSVPDLEEFLKGAYTNV